MASWVTVTCAQCGSPITGEPVALGAEQFCCLGCVGGGPCICDTQRHDALTLHVGPFASQSDLLRFAARLEKAPGLLHVEMTNASLEDARFSVVALSTPVLALAVQANPDHRIAVETVGAVVTGRITPTRPRPSPSVDTLLPTRTRFRVFRGASEASLVDEAPVPITNLHPQPPPAGDPDRGEANEEQIAELLANARARAREQQAARTRMPAAAFLPASATPPRVEQRAPAATPEPATVRSPAEQQFAREHQVIREVAIVAGPFESFVALNEFQTRIREIAGVTEARVRRFYRGSLDLTVDVEDVTQLAERLRDAAGGAWRVATDGDRIEIMLAQTPPAAPATI